MSPIPLLPRQQQPLPSDGPLWCSSVDNTATKLLLPLETGSVWILLPETPGGENSLPAQQNTALQKVQATTDEVQTEEFQAGPGGSAFSGQPPSDWANFPFP